MVRKVFSKHQAEKFEAPNLLQVQTDSYRWFLDVALKELLKEISPIEDWTGNEMELHFKDFKLDEAKYDERQAREKNISFEAPLRVTVLLKNKTTKAEQEQEIYLGDFPLMTPRGTFIINGVERVVISQLIRSPGVFFTMNQVRGRKLYGAKIIPNRGAWLELETEIDGTIIAKIDRRRKIPVTSILRIFGLENADAISEAFGGVDRKSTRLNS